jgi:hypothetical protein
MTATGCGARPAQALKVVSAKPNEINVNILIFSFHTR